MHVKYSTCQYHYRIYGAVITTVKQHTGVGMVALAHCCWPYENGDDCRENKGCFPSSVKVRLEDGRSVPMSELQEGDRVQTGLQ